MCKLFRRLWDDESGALIAIEWVFFATIMIIGITVGLVAVRNATNAELTEMGGAITSLNQSYFFTGTVVDCGFRHRHRPVAWTAGSFAVDVEERDRERFHNFHDVEPNFIEQSPCN